MSIVTKKVSNLIEAIGQEHAFPITEAEARRYRLVGKKTVAIMQGLGLIKPPDNVPYPQPAHPLHQSDPELAWLLAVMGIWTASDAEKAVLGSRLQPDRGEIPNLGKARYSVILQWIKQGGGWTDRWPR